MIVVCCVFLAMANNVMAPNAVTNCFTLKLKPETYAL